METLCVSKVVAKIGLITLNKNTSQDKPFFPEKAGADS